MKPKSLIKIPKITTKIPGYQSEQFSDSSSENSFIPRSNSPSSSINHSSLGSTSTTTSLSFTIPDKYNISSAYLRLPKGKWLPYENKNSMPQLPKEIKIFYRLLTTFLTDLIKDEPLIITPNILFAGDCILSKKYIPVNFEIHIEWDHDPKNRLMLTQMLKNKLQFKRAAIDLYQRNIKNFTLKIHILDPGTLVAPYFTINSLRARYDEKQDKLQMLFHTAYFHDTSAVNQHIAAHILKIPKIAKPYLTKSTNFALRILHGIHLCCNGWRFNKITSKMINNDRYLLRKNYMHDHIIQELGNLPWSQQVIALEHYHKLNLIRQLFATKPKTFRITSVELQQKICMGLSLQHLYELYHSGCWLMRDYRTGRKKIILHNLTTLADKPQNLLCAFRISQHYHIDFFKTDEILKYCSNAFDSDKLHNSIPSLHKEFRYLFLCGHAMENFLAMYRLGIFALLFAGAYRQLFFQPHLHPMIIENFQITDKSSPQTRSLKLIYHNILTLELLDLLVTFELFSTFKDPKNLNKLLANMNSSENKQNTPTPWTYKPLWDKMDQKEQHKLCGLILSLYHYYLQTHAPKIPTIPKTTQERKASEHTIVYRGFYASPAKSIRIQKNHQEKQTPAKKASNSLTNY